MTVRRGTEVGFGAVAAVGPDVDGGDISDRDADHIEPLGRLEVGARNWGWKLMKKAV